MVTNLEPNSKDNNQLQTPLEILDTYEIMELEQRYEHGDIGEITFCSYTWNY